MKVKLIHKFFFSFLAVSLLIVLLFIGAVQYFAYRNFPEYVSRAELKKLNHLTAALEEAYQEAGGWEDFLRNGQRWPELVHVNLPIDHGFFSNRLPQERENRLDPGTESPPQQPFIDTMQIGPAITLFDVKKTPLTGTATSAEGYSFREIRVDGIAVGGSPPALPGRFPGSADGTGTGAARSGSGENSSDICDAL